MLNSKVKFNVYVYDTSSSPFSDDSLDWDKSLIHMVIYFDEDSNLDSDTAALASFIGHSGEVIRFFDDTPNLFINDGKLIVVAFHA